MNPIAIDLHFIQIYWYSIFIFLGVLGASIIIFRECRRQKINENFITNLIFYSVIFGLVGARLYFCFFHWDYYSKYPLEILEVWNGGLAIHGGILIGLLIVFLYTKKYKAKFLKVTDIIVPGLILGQAIGRWGNFFNIEAYGKETTSIFRMGIKTAKSGYIEVHPVFLYESIATFIIFVILRLLQKNRRFKGQILYMYFILYGFIRMLLEGLRTDSLWLGSIRFSQILSLAFFVIFLGIYLFNYNKEIK